MNRLVETVSWLVNIASPTGEEAPIRDAIADRLETFELTGVEESLVVGRPGSDKVLLVGHLDTVPLQGESGSRIDGDRIYGLGSTDMKGGLAVMIHLIEELGTDVIVGVFYAGEEGPLSGNQLGSTLNLFPESDSSPAGIVLEPTNRQVEAGCNGAINARVSFVGEPAHSSRPWLGVNAVTRAGEFLAGMHERRPEDHEVDGLVFREVVSVTRASGGIANNVIPGRFDLNLNYRFAPDRSLEDARARLKQVCSDADEFDITDAAPAATPVTDLPLFEQIASASGSGFHPKQGWTDVAQLSARGIPAINFGPGESALAHKPGESLRIDDLGWAYQTLLEVLS